MPPSCKFPDHILWLPAFAALHWLLFVGSLATKAVLLMPFFSAPLLFANIIDLWAPHFPGPSAHSMIFLNSIIAGSFIWYVVRLVVQDTRWAKSLSNPPRRWPSLLVLTIGCLAMFVFYFLTFAYVAVSESSGEKTILIPGHYSMGLTFIPAFIGLIAISLVSFRAIWMKWHRPLLPVIAILVVLILSFLAFDPETLS